MVPTGVSIKEHRSPDVGCPVDPGFSRAVRPGPAWSRGLLRVVVSPVVPIYVRCACVCGGGEVVEFQDRFHGRGRWECWERSARAVAAVSIAAGVNAAVGVGRCSSQPHPPREDHDAWNGLDEVLGGIFLFVFVLNRTLVVYRFAAPRL